MARFQTLPDRIDCVCNTVNDQVMCVQYGNVIDCCIIYANTKCQLNVMSGCCCAWTVPPGVCSIFVEMWGAGAGGTGGSGCGCCAQGLGGGAGGYISTTIPTKPGCSYTICAGLAGVFGCGACSRGGDGTASYMTGYNAGSICATGGCGCDSSCNTPRTCYGQNLSSGGDGCFTSTVFSNNVLRICGETGHQFGQAQGCRFENRGGSAGFNGGSGGWNSYISGSQYTGSGVSGTFPGGGGSGSITSCCCTYCACGGCGGNGLVRIWF